MAIGDDIDMMARSLGRHSRSLQSHNLQEDRLKTKLAALRCKELVAELLRKIEQWETGSEAGHV